MDWLSNILDVFLHLDEHLADFIGRYGLWTYGVLFVIVFCETGLVVTPFLPGDSLLFAAGSMAALGVLSPHTLFVLLSIAAIIGDTVNYFVGHMLGPRVFRGEARFLKKEYLDRTHRFYEKYGGKTIILARFVPIIRTFAPFVAGVGAMTYSKFILYNIVGGLVWVAMFVYGGFYFGNIPLVKNNFEIVILAIIFLSILPGIIEFIRHHRENRKESAASSLSQGG